MKLNRYKNKSGFTLIEVLFVVGIVAFLAIGAFSLFNGGKEKAKVKISEDTISQLETSVKSFRQRNNKFPNPVDQEGNILENGRIGLLSENQNFLSFVNNIPINENGFLTINNNLIYYGLSIDGSYYVLGTIVENPGTGNMENIIRTNFPENSSEWTLFNDTNEVIVNGAEDPLLSDIVLDGSVYVSQGFTVVKQDSDTLRIKLTAPLGTATADEAATEVLFTLNGLSFGDNTALDAGTSVIELKVAGDIDVAQDSIQLAGAATLDNPNNLVVSGSFREKTVLASLLGTSFSSSINSIGEVIENLTSYFVEIFTDENYSNDAVTNASWLEGTLNSESSAELSSSNKYVNYDPVSTDSPANLITCGTYFYFTADDRDNYLSGTSLYRNDVDGNIEKLSGGDYTPNNGYSYLTCGENNGEVFMLANDAYGMRKAYRYTDGNGFEQYSNFNSTPNDDLPEDFVIDSVNNILYFTSYRTATTRGVFSYDPTNGVQLISSTQARNLFLYGGYLYFTGNESSYNNLYRFDPSTRLFNTLYSGTIRYSALSGNRLYFEARNSTTGNDYEAGYINLDTGTFTQLPETNLSTDDQPYAFYAVPSGTANRVYYLSVNSNSRRKLVVYDNINGLVEIPVRSDPTQTDTFYEPVEDSSGKVYFAASNDSGYSKLFSHDFTNGLQELSNINVTGSDSIGFITLFNDEPYFYARNSLGEDALYKYNTSLSTVEMITDIKSGASDGIYYLSEEKWLNSGLGNPRKFLVFEGKLYFGSYTDTSGVQRRLHSYDPVNGVQLVDTGNLCNLSAGFYGYISEDQNKLFFHCSLRLYSYDEVNGFQSLSSESYQNPRFNITEVDGNIVFSANKYYTIDTSWKGKIWIYNPTDGLEAYEHISTTGDNDNINGIYPIGGEVLFSLHNGSQYSLYKYNPNNDSLVELESHYSAGISQLTEYNGELFMSSRNTTGSGYTKLYRYNTNGSFSEIPGSPNSSTTNDSPSYLTVWNNKLYMRILEGGSRSKMYSYDSTNGLVKVFDILPGVSDNINEIYGGGSDLYFKAYNTSSFYKLHKYNESDGYQTLPEIKIGTHESVNAGLIVGNDIYFQAHNTSNLYKLFKYTESSNSITQVGETSSPTTSDNIQDLTLLEDNIYFEAINSSGVSKFFYSDGENIYEIPGGGTNPNGSDYMSYVTEFNGKLYFRSRDGSNQQELFEFDPSGLSYDIANNLLVSTDVAGGEEMSGSEILVNATTPAGTSYDLEVSDNGSDWTMIANDQTGNLPQVATNITGTSFYWRITLNGTTSSAPTISRVEILK